MQKNAQKEQKVLSYDSTHTHTWPIERLAVDQRRRRRAVSLFKVTVRQQIAEVVASVVSHGHAFFTDRDAGSIFHVTEAARKRRPAHL